MPVNIQIRNGSLTDRSKSSKRRIPPKNDKVVQRLLDRKKEADEKVRSLKRRKEMEIKYKIMKSKPSIN